MSANNGNRSRFHRDRKRRIARRIQTKALMAALAEKPATPAAPKAKASKKKPAAAAAPETN